MTADGYYVEFERRHDGTSWTQQQRAQTDPEWQDRHADLAATLRTVLAMCAYTERTAPPAGGEAHLARRVRRVIEQATEWPGR